MSGPRPPSPPDPWTTTTVPRPVYEVLKRLLDVAGAVVLLAILAPVMAVVWLLVRIKLGPPAVFTQVRPGLRARPFTIHKFRSMKEARDAQGEPLPDAERITPLGRLLRRTSLDELPQLFDVLRGDMSFVGPRPLLMEYVPRYSPEQRRRMDVKPGITGLAQVEGRTSLGWERRLSLDVEYVDRRSILLDFRILLRTLRKVVRSEGIADSGIDLNPKFQGRPDPPV